MLLKRCQPLLLIALLALTTITLHLGLRTSSDKAAPLPPPPPPLAVSAPANAVAGAAEDTTLAEAIRQNALLQNDLSWTFGKKQQRGWYLYVPLISRLIGTEADPASTKFAQTLARWQRINGLAANGVLNSDTLYRMMETWQARRLTDRTPARPDQLVTVPASEFYDSSRPDEQRQIERETYAAYQRMLAAATADRVVESNHLKIISAHRSREYQDNLRRKEPNAGRAGLATNSPHFTGRALDLYVGGAPVDTKDANRALQIRTRAYRWLVRHAERFGFRPYPYEPWHWEYVRTYAIERGINNLQKVAILLSPLFSTEPYFNCVSPICYSIQEKEMDRIDRMHMIQHRQMSGFQQLLSACSRQSCESCQIVFLKVYR